MNAAQAQGLVNFSILVPGSLPADCRADIDVGSLRREDSPDPAPAAGSWFKARTASYIYRIQGQGRALRCKQYLYDLGPLSALDHAALYDHDVDTLAARDMDGRRLCWLGTDYARKRAAAFFGWGTNAELRVTEGKFSDDELVSIAAGMTPQAQMTRPFAELTYWSRYPRYDLNLCSSKYRPPSSLWKLRWPWAAVDHSWTTAPVGSWNSAAIKDEWAFDSACRFGQYETQALYYPADGTRHQVLWLREFPQELAPLKKPELDSYSGFSRFPITNAAIGARTIFIASVRPDCGPHDALWWEDGKLRLAQASSRVGHDVAAFTATLSRLF